MSEQMATIPVEVYERMRLAEEELLELRKAITEARELFKQFCDAQDDYEHMKRVEEWLEKWGSS